MSPKERRAMSRVLERHRRRLAAVLARVVGRPAVPAGLAAFRRVRDDAERQRCAFQESRSCFVMGDTGRRMRGITRAIEQGFGAVSPKKPKRPPKRARRAGGGHGPRGGTMGPRTVHAACVCGGKAHGTLVHEQLAAFVDALHAGRPLSLGARTDRCTLRLVVSLTARGWLPMAAETCLWHPGGLATAVDLFCLDVNRAGCPLVLVELKVGYDSPGTVGGAVFEPDCPWAGRPRTPDALHQLQLRVMRAMLHASWPRLAVEAAVLRVGRHRVQLRAAAEDAGGDAALLKHLLLQCRPTASAPSVPP